MGLSFLNHLAIGVAPWLWKPPCIPRTSWLTNTVSSSQCCIRPGCCWGYGPSRPVECGRKIMPCLPATTGNGLHIPHENADDWGVVYEIVILSVCQIWVDVMCLVASAPSQFARSTKSSALAASAHVQMDVKVWNKCWMYYIGMN